MMFAWAQERLVLSLQRLLQLKLLLVCCQVSPLHRSDSCQTCPALTARIGHPVQDAIQHCPLKVSCVSSMLGLSRPGFSQRGLVQHRTCQVLVTVGLVPLVTLLFWFQRDRAFLDLFLFLASSVSNTSPLSSISFFDACSVNFASLAIHCSTTLLKDVLLELWRSGSCCWSFLSESHCRGFRTHAARQSTFGTPRISHTDTKKHFLPATHSQVLSAALGVSLLPARSATTFHRFPSQLQRKHTTRDPLTFHCL